jgi:hypothetical protein
MRCEFIVEVLMRVLGSCEEEGVVVVCRSKAFIVVGVGVVVEDIIDFRLMPVGDRATVDVVGVVTIGDCGDVVVIRLDLRVSGSMDFGSSGFDEDDVVVVVIIRGLFWATGWFVGAFGLLVNTIFW